MMALIAGVDEVGRGPLVGDVVTAAVILDPARPIAGLNDSKKLSARKREALALEIRDKALAFAIARASVAEIDHLNILHATMLAMQRAVLALPLQPTLVLVDGNRAPQLPMAVQTLVGGDGREPAISAASILAKVTRDGEMAELARRYPAYGFDCHKGYPTADHLAALARHGALAEHRRSFRPVAEVLAQQELF